MKWFLLYYFGEAPCSQHKYSTSTTLSSVLSHS